MARLKSARIVLALAAEHGLQLRKWDAVAAFLNGELEEELFMEQPPGYEKDDRVCLLQRAIYGLKQASKCWFDRLKNALLKIGFTASDVDPCVYFYEKRGEKAITSVHVDDMLLAISSKRLRKWLQAGLFASSRMKVFLTCILA